MIAGYAVSFVLGACVGAAVLSWCAAGKQTFDRVDVFFEGWRSGWRAAHRMDDQAPAFRSVDAIEAEHLLHDCGYPREAE